MKHSILTLQRFRRLALLCLTWFLMIPAAYSVWSDENFTVRWDVNSGCYIVKLYYYQNFGSGADIQPEGFRADNGGAHVYLDNTYMLTVKQSGGWDHVYAEHMAPGVSMSGAQWNYVSVKKNKWKCFVEIKLPTRSVGLHTIKVQGTWWRWSVFHKDQRIDKSHNSTATVGLSSVEVTGGDYLSSSGKQYRIFWRNKEAGADNHLSSVKLLDYNTRKYVQTQNGSNSSGTFYINIDGSNVDLNNSGRYAVVRIYERGKLQLTHSADHVRLAYPQPTGQIGMSMNKEQRKLTIKWQLTSGPASSYLADPMRLELKVLNADKTKVVNTITREIPYERGRSNYSTEMQVPDGFQNNYHVQIGRKAVWDNPHWASHRITKEGKFRLQHHKVLHPAVQLNSDNLTATLTWGYPDEGFWSAGSRLKIYRYANGSPYEDVVLTVDNERDFLKGKMVDATLASCNSYEYKFQMVPGGNYAVQAMVPAEGIVEPVEIGSISTVNASKGYYSQFTRIDWETEGGFDDFDIYRREHQSGANADKFTKVGNVECKAGVSTYTFDDSDCPGDKVLEYYVVGNIYCANQQRQYHAQSDTVIGYRVPRGDVYGHISYQNKQAVNNVLVSLSSSNKEESSGYSVRLGGSENDYLITDKNLLQSNRNYAFQIYVRPDVQDVKQLNCILMKKGNYELGLKEGKPYFKVDRADINAAFPIGLSNFTQISVSYSAATQEMLLVVNGEHHETRHQVNPYPISLHEGTLLVGQKFKGWVDEIRVWNRSLTPLEIKENYFRMLSGNEEQLIAYYPMNEDVGYAFYDGAYDRNGYMENHGTLKGNAAYDAAVVPTSEQLSYADITDDNGNYLVHNVPYLPEGSAYTLTLHMEGHKFMHKNSQDPVTVILNEKKDDYQIDYTDISSFSLSGHVYYVDSEVPVSGVTFTIDNRMVVDSTFRPVMTKDDGSFRFNVPVGHHSVCAVKPGHVFYNGGRLLKADGGQLNYTQDLSGVEFIDSTKVRLIGKVVGGHIQFDKPTGFSLSNNNLSNVMYLDLQLKGKTGNLTSKGEYIDTLQHCDGEHFNEVEVTPGRYRIRMDSRTGEFYADLFPEEYTKVQLHVEGRGDVLTEHEPIDLSRCTEPEDRWYPMVAEEGKPQMKLTCHKEASFMVTDKPQLWAREVWMNNMSEQESKSTWSAKDYLGNKEEIVSVFGDTEMLVDTVQLYNSQDKENPYLFGKPVYKENEIYTFMLTGFVPYYYNNDPESGKVDTVPVNGGKVFVANTFHEATDSVMLNDSGVGFYQFIPDNPDISFATQGVKTLDFTLLSGGEEYTLPTIDGYLLGSESCTPDFITTGPNELLYVLRDPPGSNSNSYVSRLNVTSNTLSNIVGGGFMLDGGVHNLMNVAFYIAVGGLPGAPVHEKVDFQTKATFGFDAQLTYDHTFSKGNTKTLTVSEKVQTSASPEFVGRNGDILIGLSTNIGVGESNCIGIKREECVIEGVDKVAKTAGGFSVCKNTAMMIGQTDSTLFAYPQVHIERTLLPKIEKLINNMLERGRNLTDAAAKEKAERMGMYVYCPKYKMGEAYYGQPNPNGAEYNTARGCFEGDYYDIFCPSIVTNNIIDGHDELCDSVQIEAVMRDNWLSVLAQNERTKVEAIAAGGGQNVSYQGGASVVVNKSFSSQKEFTRDFVLNGAFGFSTENGVQVRPLKGWKIAVKMNGTLHYNYKKNSTETEREDAGFVLSDVGGDYMSVDVYNVKDEYTTGSNHKEETDAVGEWVFFLRGGVTTNPHEGVQKTRYYDAGNHLLSEGSLQVEIPKLAVEKAVISNVPATKPAVFDFKMYNESQAHRKAWFTLKLAEMGEDRNYAYRILIDGSPLGEGRDFLLGEGNVLHKKVEVYRSGDDYDLKDLKFVLAAKNQSNPLSYNGVIADTLLVSAHFIPSSTEVNIKEPGNHWVLNRNSEMEDGRYYLPVYVDGFNVNEPRLERIEIQYKPLQMTTWSSLRVFYKDSVVMNQAENVDKTMKEYIGQKNTLMAKFFGEDDQKYDIRAVSYSKYGNEYVTYASETMTGVKDTQTPRLFGHPTPANHILNMDDELMFVFNEPIDAGRVVHKNFEVTAVKNHSRSNREVSVHFNGEGDKLESLFAKDWSGKDLTVEMWLRMDDVEKEGIIFRHGDANAALTLEKTSGHKISAEDHQVEDAHFCVRYNGLAAPLFSSSLTLKEQEWYHLAMTLDAASRRVQLFLNGGLVGETTAKASYEGVGKIELGNHFYGDIDEVRIWNKVLEGTAISELSHQRLSGAEPLLMAYYPMDEARGMYAADKARGNTLKLQATWNSAPGYALRFSGDGKLMIDNQTTVVRPQDSYTLEFWFKTQEAVSDSAALFSTGKGDGTDTLRTAGNMLIGFEGHELVVRSNGNRLLVSGQYDDQMWHHFLLTVNRNFGYAQVYVDGEKRAYANDSYACALDRPELCFGARHYRTGDALEWSTDQYFKGWIDEIRLWQTAFTEFEVTGNGNATMRGNEAGLFFYYPFEEWFVNGNNIREMRFTYQDQVQHHNEATPVAGVAASKNEYAPLTNKGVETPVDFDFAVNKDRVLIQFIEKEANIDNTIVNITLNNLRDLNGNAMDNAVRWSAFVHRQPLQWGESEKHLDLQQHEEVRFTMPLNNLTGASKHYVLEGLPVWMEASPSEGMVAANSSQEIEFRISPETPVGRYDECIYARGDNDVAAALPIEVKINGERPDWSVNPQDYEHNLVVFGRMQMGKELSADEEDMLGVFHLGQCMGVAHSQYDAHTDMWYTYLTIYRKSKPAEVEDCSNDYEFRMWDASTGRIYEANPSEPLIFKQGVCGSMDQLIVFADSDVTYRQIHLAEGWNWVTLGVLDDARPTVDHTLRNGTWTMDDVVKGKNSFFSYSPQQRRWEGTGKQLDRTQMYVVSSGQPQILSIAGTEKLEQPVHLAAHQWNYVGYLPECTLPVREALAGYAAQEGDILKSQDEFAMFSEGSWVGSLKTMKPNLGYMMYTAHTDSFSYPQRVAVRAARSAAGADGPDVQLHYPATQTLVCVPEYADLQVGDLIAVYADDELRGIAQPVEVEGKAVHFLSVAGANKCEAMTCRLLRDGKCVAEAQAPLLYQPHAMGGDVKHPLTISFDAKENQVVAYPNPFVELLNIEFFAAEEGQAQIEVFDLAGRRLLNKVIDAQPGRNKYVWHSAASQSAQCAGGVHLVRVTVDGTTSVLEVIKK